MNTSAATVSDQFNAFMAPIAAQFNSLLASPAAQRNALLITLAVVVGMMLLLVIAISFLPRQRKVVRKRLVRRTRRLVETPEGEEASQPAETAAASSGADASTAPAKGRAAGQAGTVVAFVALALVVVASFVGVYFYTGTNTYCGLSCHGTDPQVALAVKNPHADCIDCHEAGPATGTRARVRMAISHAGGEATITAIPVDPSRCLRCHGNIESGTVKTKSGLIVSHKEILAGGRTCSDCHRDVGHRKGTALAGGMSTCTPCHDGVKASRECPTCHAGGSPLTVAGAATKARTTYDYGPAVRVSSWNCPRCHGAETECRNCHNGFVLPHPREFVEGGHAMTAAFSGKEKCYKCHSITWCGNGKCHHGFMTHNESYWLTAHQSGTSEACGSCHTSWDPSQGSFCSVCHK